jgi:hypothetical protein
LGGTASRWTPEDAEVVTDDGWAFPYKLMFIGRTGTLAGEKIYATVPSKDARVSRRVYVASAKPPEGFAASTGGIATTREIAGPLETWYLTTVDFSPTSK